MRKKKELFSIRAKLSSAKFFKENLLAIEMEKTQILMNKPVYLGLSILQLSKILMYEFWYDVLNQNMVKKQNCVIWIQTVSLRT